MYIGFLQKMFNMAAILENDGGFYKYNFIFVHRVKIRLIHPFKLLYFN